MAPRKSLSTNFLSAHAAMPGTASSSLSRMSSPSQPIPSDSAHCSTLQKLVQSTMPSSSSTLNAISISSRSTFDVQGFPAERASTSIGSIGTVIASCSSAFLEAASSTMPPLLPNRPPTIPNELLLHIFDYLPTHTLLNIRLVASRTLPIANAILLRRLTTEVSDLGAKLTAAEAECKDAEKEKRPHLRHYRGFLRNISTHDVTEATWYASPPEELKTVCECLCILYRYGTLANNDVANADPHTLTPSPTPSFSSSSSSPSSLGSPSSTATASSAAAAAAASCNLAAPMTWAAIKKQMTRFDFKNWLTNLRMGVDHIPHPAIKRVERIIMMDPSITYERMREVSTAGYKLLIVVAACLQYGSIAEELRGLRKTVSIVERRRGRLLAFVEGVAEIGAAQVGEEDAADTELTLLENDVAPAAE